MIVRKKTLFIVGAAAGALIAILTSASMLASLYLNRPVMKERVRSALSREIGGTVNFERLTVSLLPLPHVTVSNLDVVVPETAAGGSTAIAVFPQLLPLMQGRVLLSKIELIEPDITVYLQDKPGEETSIPSLPELQTQINKARAALEMIGPGFVVRVVRGRLALSRQVQNIFTLKEIDARIAAPRSVVEVRVHAIADAWGALSLKGRLTYSDDRAELSEVSGTLGRSSFSGLSARLTLVRPMDFQVLSGKADLSLDELYAWLLASGEGEFVRKHVQSIKGSVTLSSFGFGGPVSRVSDWQMTASGSADDVIMRTSLLPAPLTVTGGFTVSRDAIEVMGLSVSLGRSRVSRLSARIDGKKNDRLVVRSGEATLALDQLFEWRSLSAPLGSLLKDVRKLSGIARLSQVSLSGPLEKPALWNMAFSGDAKNVVVDSSLLPGPISIARGTFRRERSQLSIADVRGTFLDASLTMSGTFKGFPGTITGVNLSIDGNFGPGGIQWAFDTFALPEELLVNPFSLSEARIAWQQPNSISFSGTAALSTGPVVFVDLANNAKGISIHSASITDQESNANFAYDQRDNALTLSFAGNLAQNTLNRILVKQTLGKGNITGDVRATLLTGRHEDSLLQGSLSGNDIIIPLLSNRPLKIDRFSLHADGNLVTLDSAIVAMGNSQGLVTGTTRASTDGFIIGLTAAADFLDLNEIQEVLSSLSKKENGPAEKTTVTGTIKVQAAGLRYGEYTFSPVSGTVAIEPSRVVVTIAEAGLCGLSSPGALIFTPGEVQLNLRPTALAQELSTVYACVSRENTSMSGTFDLVAFLNARGKAGELLRALDGTVELRAKDGTIRKYPLLAKIFSILSVTEIFRGKLPDFGRKGFAYSTMTVKGNLKQGKFVIDQVFIDGSSITLLAEGEVDLAEGTADLVVLVAPFSTVNWVIRHIPLLGKVMGGTLISIPVKVSGKLDDPDVVILDPSAVGSRIVELFKNILQLPVEIISPILPEKYK
ncbi:MAG: hypothetical protein A2X58_04175 [Nitrospirae bacterium GWC2_56_14]|nr:MAG: hypothetical protein A2X58_04175 [Nitrospirae bacterium GWC2_56_14]